MVLIYLLINLNSIKQTAHLISRALHPWLQQPLLRMTRSRRAHPHRRARRCHATVAATMAVATMAVATMAVATMAVAVDAGCNAAKASVSEAGEHGIGLRSRGACWSSPVMAKWTHGWGDMILMMAGWWFFKRLKTSMLIHLWHIYIIWNCDDVSCWCSLENAVLLRWW